MKTLLKSLSLASLTLFAVACHKPAEIDVRDNYVGNYSVTATIAAKYDGVPTGSTVIRYTLKIVKGKVPNELLLTDNTIKDTDNPHTAVLSGNKFEVPVFTTTVVDNGTTKAIKTIGSGTFGQNSVNLNYTGNTYENYKTNLWDWIGTGIKF